MALSDYAKQKLNYGAGLVTPTNLGAVTYQKTGINVTDGSKFVTGNKTTGTVPQVDAVTGAAPVADKKNTGKTDAGKTDTDTGAQGTMVTYTYRPAQTESGQAAGNTAGTGESIPGGYQPSQTVLDAQAKLNELLGNAPGGYESKYGDSLQKLYDQVMNPQGYESRYDPQLRALYDQAMGRGGYESRYGDQLAQLYDEMQRRPDFYYKYDLNGDALYQQYRENAMHNGQLAMQDTLGQAQAMTGGYGNSYAAAAGNAAYNQYLQSLNDIVPELEQRAYDRAWQQYQQAGDDLKTRYALAQQADQRDYERWQDEGNELLNRYALTQQAENSDYQRWKDALSAAQDRYALTQQADQVDYSRWADGKDDYYNRLNAAMNMLDKERGWDYQQYADRLDQLVKLAQLGATDEGMDPEAMAELRRLLMGVQAAGGSSGSAAAGSAAGASGGKDSGSYTYTVYTPPTKAELLGIPTGDAAKKMQAANAKATGNTGSFAEMMLNGASGMPVVPQNGIQQALDDLKKK